MGRERRWPLHGWFGVGLVVVFWPLNWMLPGLRTHWAFFPLWLGYCLLVDALVVWRKGHSLLTRDPCRYLGLFLLSVPVWWLFELFNQRTQNWAYDGREHFGNLEYALLASLSFSTVMPAVFGTAELVGAGRWTHGVRNGLRIAPSSRRLSGLFVTGWLMLGLLLVWPVFFFPFLWAAVFCILEPINVWRGHRSLWSSVAAGDWRPVVALCCGVLICGFFWEMWNVLSYPKWIYRVPFVDTLHVFEMPLLGYVGYLPFALELFAIYHLISGLLGRAETAPYLQMCAEPFHATPASSVRD